MAQPKEFWALTLNLAKSEEGPTIMPASDLFQYKPGRKCFRFKPKSATLKDKFEEFGVVTDLLGGEKLVRHHIIALNEDKEALQKLVVDKPRRTAVGLNRLLTSPAIEVKSSYSFPDEEKALRRELKDEKANTTKAIKDAQVKDGNDILKSFERMKAGKNNTSNNCALDAENINLVVPGNGGTAGGVEKLQDIPTEEERKESEEESLAGFHNDMMKVSLQDQKQEQPNEGKKVNKKAKKDKKKTHKRKKFEKKPTSDEEKKEGNEMKTKNSEENGEETGSKEIAIPCNKENHEHLQELLLITEGKLAQAYTVIAGQRKEIEKLQETVAKQQELLEEAAVAKPQESFVTVSALKEILATTLPGVSGETSSEGFVKRTKHSKLSTLPQNLVDDKEIKDTDKIKVGANRLVNRTSLLTIEEASAHFCGRVELLVELFYGAKASRYSVKPKSNHHISMEEIESMKVILSHMKWIKSETITFAKIKKRVISYTSALRCTKTKGLAENIKPGGKCSASSSTAVQASPKQPEKHLSAVGTRDLEVDGQPTRKRSAPFNPDHVKSAKEPKTSATSTSSDTGSDSDSSDSSTDSQTSGSSSMCTSASDD